MSTKQNMCVVVGLIINRGLFQFAPLMFAGLPNHFPLLTSMLLASIKKGWMHLIEIAIKEKKIGSPS